MAKSTVRWAGGEALAVVKNRLAEALGFALLLACLLLFLSLLTYDPRDGSLNTAVDAMPHNFLGHDGAVLADLLWQSLGLACFLIPILLLAWSFRLMLHRPASVHLDPIGAPSGGPDTGGGSAFDPRSRSALSAGGPRRRHWLGHGAAFGALRSRHRGVAYLDGGCGSCRPPVAGYHGAVFARLACDRCGRWAGCYTPRRAFRKQLGRGELSPCSGLAPVGRNRVSRATRKPIATPMPPRCAARRSSLRCPAGANPGSAKPNGARDRGGLVRFIAPTARPPAPGKRAEGERQPALDLEPEQQPILPSLELLVKPPAAKAEAINEEALEKNARLLETVLEDFGVRGQIVQVRPGPVVTLYEFEPAPGIKASRIIGLADDIARSMSAISVRVAVVSGPQRDRHRAPQPQGGNGFSARAARFAGLREASRTPSADPRQGYFRRAGAGRPRARCRIC